MGIGSTSKEELVLVERMIGADALGIESIERLNRLAIETRRNRKLMSSAQPRPFANLRNEFVALLHYYFTVIVKSFTSLIPLSLAINAYSPGGGVLLLSRGNCSSTLASASTAVAASSHAPFAISETGSLVLGCWQ